ncbi:MAG: hypothetical protein WAU00_04725, partial [Caldilinea sp.]
LSITLAERQRLGELYLAGQSLWRMPISHFSAWDANWGWGPPPDAEFPNQPEPYGDDTLDDPCEKGLSIIECQNQILGEAVELVGTPHSLHYRSDRVPGREAAYTLDISLSGANVPASLKRIELVISVAGRQFFHVVDSGRMCNPPLLAVQPVAGRAAIPATAAETPSASLIGQNYRFTWDGKDAYGRILQGAQPTTVRLGYVYCGVYAQTNRFGYNGNGLITGSSSRQEAVLWQVWRTTLGTWDARPQGLGGWTLDVHHAYDPASQTLYLGNGERQSAQAMGEIVTTVAGKGFTSGNICGTSGPATQMTLNAPVRVAVAPDGGIYIAPRHNNCILRLDPDGTLRTVVGNGVFKHAGDGGPASKARIETPWDVAVGPDGSYYISEYWWVRRVGLDGVISTVAGLGRTTLPGDFVNGLAATKSGINAAGIAVGPDGSLYIVELYRHRVRRVGTDGIITTVAGTGTRGYNGDGILATKAHLADPRGVAVGPDGSLYIANTGMNCVRRVGPDGIITTVAGTCYFGPISPVVDNGDGGPATKAKLRQPHQVAVDSEGNLYIVDIDFSTIRRVGSDGIITTLAGRWGGPTGTFSGDNGPAPRAQFARPEGVAVGPDGSVYVADTLNHLVRRVAPAAPWMKEGGFYVAAEDGSEVYAFNRVGRHVATFNAFTGAKLYEFGYDAGGRLMRVTDGDRNVTTIDHNDADHTVTIVGPYGQRTILELDAAGYLRRVTNRADESTDLTYVRDGLLETLTNPRGFTYRFAYDDLGRLTREEDPAGGNQALARTELTSRYTVTMTTAMSSTTQYQVVDMPNGDQQQINIFPDNTQSELLTRTSGSRRLTLPDGTVTEIQEGPDPRWGMNVPLLTSVKTTPPGGVQTTVTTERQATQTIPTDPL